MQQTATSVLVKHSPGTAQAQLATRLMLAERAEAEVKAAADALNKQLPEEAQGGSLQPLVEEKEEGQGQSQPLDTFSSEIDSFDMVSTCSCDHLLPLPFAFEFSLLPVGSCPFPLLDSWNGGPSQHHCHCLRHDRSLCIKQRI